MQKIYYGAPGTGKSFKIDKKLNDDSIPDDRIYRTTFHPEYSYSDFVGQLLPTVTKVPGGTSTVTYKFSKGIFTRALEKAYEDTSKEVFLIIEEMSRGDCAAIFGDIFQLLDREKSGINKGYSRYFVSNEVIAKDIIALPNNHIKLPANFSIVGTVNTSDQNVYVMDTAFKRRFEWEYISTKPKKSPVSIKEYMNNVNIELNCKTGTKIVSWINLYGTLNIVISSEKYLDLGEDKQLGQFFIEFDDVTTQDEVKLKIQNKLLHFLWNDVHKISYKNTFRLFTNKAYSFSDLYDMFENNEQIFSDEFFECIELWEKNLL